MESSIKRLPDTELEVMLAVWEGDAPVHTGEILRRVEASGKKTKLQAVQTLLSRLCDKGFLHCEKLGRLNYYHPLVQKDSYLAAETASFVERVYDNSPARLIAALAGGYTFTAEELAELRAILEREKGEQ